MSKKDGNVLYFPQAVEFDLKNYGDIIPYACLLYTSDATDERSSVDLGGRRIIKKKNNHEQLKTLKIVSTTHTTQLRIN